MRQERICFTRGGILCPRGMLLLFWLLLLYAACFSRANEENRDSGDGTADRHLSSCGQNISGSKCFLSSGTSVTESKRYYFYFCF